MVVVWIGDQCVNVSLRDARSTRVQCSLSGFGKIFVAIALFFFAFTTLLAYYYIAETNVAYIKRTFNIPGLMLILKIGLMGTAFYGAIRTASLAWAMGDIGVGLMAWLNIVGILIIFLVAKPAIKALRDYERQQRAGVERYSFDPQALGIKNALFWENRIAEGEKVIGDDNDPASRGDAV